MPKLINFEQYKVGYRSYGGASGQKINLHMEGSSYMLKFPANLKDAHMKNVLLSYSNSPICEYLGSQVYKIIGIPVHNTILGEYQGKTVVACEHVYGPGEYLDEFSKLMVSFVAHDPNNEIITTSGTTSDLEDILYVLDSHPVLRDVLPASEHFWNMFVVDALIGNSDRNNGNWGVIVNENTSSVRLSPVYDNGASFNNKWDDGKILRYIQDDKLFESIAHKGVSSIFNYNGHRVNPFKIIDSMEFDQCNEAVKRVVPGIDIGKINDVIYELEEDGIISSIKSDFYIELLNERLNSKFIPVFRKILELEETQIEIKP